MWLVAACPCNVPAVVDVFELSSHLVDDFSKSKPVTATRSGVAGYETEWGDQSPAGHDAHTEMLASYRADLDGFDSDDPWASHAAQAMDQFLSVRLDLAAADHHLRDLNATFSPFQTTRSVFDVMDRETPQGRSDIIGRMAGVPAALDQYRETLELGRSRGVVTGRRQVEACIAQGRTNSGSGSSFRRLESRIAPELGESESAQLREAVDAACSAFGAFSDYLEREYLGSAELRDGVGRDRYELGVSAFLGTSVDLEETYSWGWDQVRAFRAQMEEAAAGIDRDSTLDEVVAMLGSDPARAAGSREEFLDAIQAQQNKAVEAVAGRHFDVPDRIRTVTVNFAPPGGGLGAYYVGPSEDFSRPGSIWYSVGDQEVFPMWDEVTTAYHEGFPGHHMQHGILMCLGNRISRLQRTYAWTSGTGEGWALYTERLMNELGFLQKPEYVLGMLSAHMFRACRVVIDIGSHLGWPIPDDAILEAGGSWTFRKAVEMLTDFAYLAPATARDEVTRYLGWPGQAIAYLVGERVILDLRQEAKSALGDGFELKAFHENVLAAGSVGLDLLRSRVRQSF